VITGKAVTCQYLLPARPESVREARRRVREALGPHVGDELLSDIELVVSELVTNSVRHGPGDPISLRLVKAPSGVSGEVVDEGDGVVAIRNRERTAAGGLGLPLVDYLTSAWGVYPGSTHVWFRFDATDPRFT
jgi:anti-sigma regulatory factor (Ser/Thr protein kinase)